MRSLFRNAIRSLAVQAGNEETPISERDIAIRSLQGMLHTYDEAERLGLFDKPPQETEIATETSEGWTEWNGGACPEELIGKRIEAKLRSGKEATGNAVFFSWGHDGSAGDIVAYKTAKPKHKDEIVDPECGAVCCKEKEPLTEVDEQPESGRWIELIETAVGTLALTRRVGVSGEVITYQPYNSIFGRETGEWEPLAKPRYFVVSDNS